MVTTAKERRIVSIFIRLVFVGVSFATIFSLFARNFWVAELFTHFRFYYLLIQAVLLIVFLQTQRRTLMTITALLALPNAFWVGPYLLPLVGAGRADAAPAAAIKIVSLNLYFRSDNYESVKAYLRSADADILALSEYTPAWESRLRYLRRDYPHYVGQARSDQWGIAVYSRLPFSAAQLTDLGAAQTRHAKVVANIGKSQLAVYAVHLLPPVSAALARARNLQLERLATDIVDSVIPSLVVGDLNLTPFSPYFDEMLAASGLVDTRRPQGFHITWPTAPLPIWIPIDHALGDPLLPVTSVERGPAVGSDHYPLEIVIDVRALEAQNSKETRERPGLKESPKHIDGVNDV